MLSIGGNIFKFLEFPRFYKERPYLSRKKHHKKSGIIQSNNFEEHPVLGLYLMKNSLKYVVLTQK